MASPIIFVPWATTNTNQAMRTITNAARKHFGNNVRVEWRIGNWVAISDGVVYEVQDSEEGFEFVEEEEVQ